jgi:hypothetical protein
VRVQRWQINRTVLFAAVVALPAIMVILVRAAWGAPASGCEPTPGVFPDYALLGVAVGAVVLGSVLGAWAYVPIARPPGPKPCDTQAAFIAAAALALFLALVTFSLVYEAIAVEQSRSENGGSLRPITSYVRCAIQFDKVSHTGGLWTGFTFFVTGFLVGHWLWVQRGVAKLKAGVAGRQPTPDVPRDWIPYVRTIAGLVLAGCLLGIVLSTLGVPVPVDGTSAGGALAQGAGASGTYAAGMSIVIVTVFLIFIGVAGLDLYFELRQWEPVGLRVQEWSTQNRWYVGALLVVLGALVAHFLGNPVK